MQENNGNNNQNRNIRRTPNGEGGQPRRPVQGQQAGRPRPQGAPNGQVRRPVQGQPTGRPRPQGAPNGQVRRPAQGQPTGRPRPQGAPNGQPRPNGRPGANGSGAPGRPPRRGAKQNLTPQQAAKKKKKKIILFVAEICLLLLLVGIACVAWPILNQAQKIRVVDIKEDDVIMNEEVKQSLESGDSKLHNYRNIALFGVDSRSGELDKNTRTDTIMIASINLDTKEVRLVSVMRDTWLNMSTDTYNKANAAYAKGGPKQAISMLNMNLDMDITDFVTIGFDGLIDVIDAVGGVEIDVKEAEIVHLNSYQISMIGKEDGTLNAAGEPNYVATAGVDYIPVEHAGVQTLNGLQATAYARIRYVGNDFERTSRQRTVLTKVAKKAMTLNPATLNKIAEAVFPKIATSLDMSEILSLLSGIASYSVGETANFPFDGYVQTGRVGKASVVIPVDLTKNVSVLHEFLFDESGYDPSDTVKKCSQKVVSDTGVSYSGE